MIIHYDYDYSQDKTVCDTTGDKVHGVCENRVNLKYFWDTDSMKRIDL